MHVLPTKTYVPHYLTALSHDYNVEYSATIDLTLWRQNARHSLFQDVWDKLVAPFPDNLVTDDLTGINKVCVGRDLVHSTVLYCNYYYCF